MSLKVFGSAVGIAHLKLEFATVKRGLTRCEDVWLSI